MSSLIPDDFSTYIYNNETDYYNEYKKSYFATTTKKSGWDCMRHYEIMANGCIPFFPDIERCPANTMVFIPKHLLMEGNLLFARMNKLTGITQEDIHDCNHLINQLLEYTKTHLTTKALAKNILEKSNHSCASRILYLSGEIRPDYLRCTTLHGFIRYRTT